MSVLILRAGPPKYAAAAVAAAPLTPFLLLLFFSFHAVLVPMDKAHHSLGLVVVWQVAIDCQKKCSDQTYIVAYW